MELSKKVNRVVAIRDGKISSERILRERYQGSFEAGAVNWMEEETQDVFAIVYKAGRLQVPRHMLEDLCLEDNKIKGAYEERKVILSKP